MTDDRRRRAGRRRPGRHACWRGRRPTDSPAASWPSVLGAAMLSVGVATQEWGSAAARQLLVALPGAGPHGGGVAGRAVRQQRRPGRRLVPRAVAALDWAALVLVGLDDLGGEPTMASAWGRLAGVAAGGGRRRGARSSRSVRSRSRSGVAAARRRLVAARAGRSWRRCSTSPDHDPRRRWSRSSRPSSWSR